MSFEVNAAVEDIVAFLRREAERHRTVANDYKKKREESEARTWSKIAEAIGNLANRIERGEHEP
jgi:hypothetical protein